MLTILAESSLYPIPFLIYIYHGHMFPQMFSHFFLFFFGGGGIYLVRIFQTFENSSCVKLFICLMHSLTFWFLANEELTFLCLSQIFFFTTGTFIEHLYLFVLSS